MNDQRAGLTWKDTAQGQIPVSVQFDDPYFSLEDGLAETTHVFLAGNGLPERFQDGFSIAELGFGTGLNFLTTLSAWSGAGQFLFTSFEAHLMSASEAEKALTPFADVLPDVATLVANWDDLRAGQVEIGAGRLQVIAGDARIQVPAWEGKADAWYLDGFSPAKNPEMWTPELLQAVFDKTVSGGTAATYTAAGHVRRALQAAGFEVSRGPGFGRKRHMTQAVKGG